MDLISFLTTHFLEETIGGRTAPPEADVLLQELEVLMTRDGALTDSAAGMAERNLVRAYLGLTVEELERLSPEVHEWFLERFALRLLVEVQREPVETVRQVGRLFFLSERRTQHYLVVSALLALDERTENMQQSSVAFIWDHIWLDEGLSDTEKERSIAVLTEILLDQYYFCRRSRYPIRAIAQLLRSEQLIQGERDAERRPAYTSVSTRSQLLGERRGGELADLLRQP